MASKDMEDFFNVVAVDEEASEVTVVEDVEVLPPAPINQVDELLLVKPIEVRENYDTSKGALVKNLEVGGELLEQISQSIADHDPADGSQPNNRLYETAGALMKAINDTAKTLASLHQEAGNILGDVKKVEIDNSHKEINVSAADMQDFVKMLKKKGDE
jgi:hypothetical protein